MPAPEPLRRIKKRDDEDERASVRRALSELAELEFLPEGASYDEAKFDELRGAVHSSFEIPWTAITPPMERFLYACASSRRPESMVCIGIFCGNTLIWNAAAGTGSGPGAVYKAGRIVGVEIVPDKVRLAERNLKAIGVGGSIDLRCEDGHDTLERLKKENERIDWLYLDADGPKDAGPSRGKRIYVTLLEKALPVLAPGALVLAHDTTIPDFEDEDGVAHDYFHFVRDPSRFAGSVSVEIERWGIEITKV